MHYNLSDQVKITKVSDHSTANTTDVTSAEVDMAGYNGVLFISSFGTAAANNTMKAQQDTVTGMGSAADLLGTSVASGTSDEDVWIDIHQPRERFVRVVGLRGTSTTMESIWAIQYGAAVEPVDNTTSGTIIGEAHLAPAEGAA